MERVQRGPVRRVKVLGGAVALVDAEDYDRVRKMSWRLDRDGYARSVEGIRAYGKSVVIFLHHLILPKRSDHANADPLDNRRANLRYASSSQNQANRRKVRSVTGIKGVTWNRQCRKYQAGIKKDGRFHYLGLFDDPVAAGEAYEAKARDLFGEFAWSNVAAVKRERKATEDGVRELLRKSRPFAEPLEWAA